MVSHREKEKMKKKKTKKKKKKTKKSKKKMTTKKKIRSFLSHRQEILATLFRIAMKDQVVFCHA